MPPPERLAPTRESRTSSGADPYETRRQFWRDADDGWVLLSELLAATFTWGILGWLADRWLGTDPWLMSIGWVVGFGTGFYLVYARHTGRITEPTPRGGPTETHDEDHHDDG